MSKRVINARNLLPDGFVIMEMRNGISIYPTPYFQGRSFFVRTQPAIEFLRLNAGMLERTGRRTRNFLRRTIRAAGRRAKL
jgi:hypothetical protein